MSSSSAFNRGAHAVPYNTLASDNDVYGEGTNGDELASGSADSPRSTARLARGNRRSVRDDEADAKETATRAPRGSDAPPSPLFRPTTLGKTMLLTEAGRAPWYDAKGKPIESYVIGIAGGSASGKTSVARAILKALPHVPWVGIVSQDSFYKELTRSQSEAAFRNEYDFDHPNVLSFRMEANSHRHELGYLYQDFDLLREAVNDLKQCKSVELPNYSFVQHQRMPETTYMYGATVLIVEGIFVLHDPELRSLLDMKIFVQADSDLMLARRIRRDIAERGREINGVLDQYLRFVKPSYDLFVSPTSRHADIVVPGQNNAVAISVIAEHVKRQLAVRALTVRRELSEAPPVSTPHVELASSPLEGVGSGSAQGKDAAAATLFAPSTAPVSVAAHAVGGATCAAGANLVIPGSSPSSSPAYPAQMLYRSYSSPILPSDSEGGGRATGGGAAAARRGQEVLLLPPNVVLLPQTPQLRGLLTIMHDQDVQGADFVFTVDRIATLVMETALSLLPYRPRKITLWNGDVHEGLELDAHSLCSVSILRSGGVLEKSARRAIPALEQGALLIQSRDDDGEAQLFTLHLPSCLKRRSTASEAWVLLLDSQISSGAAAFMAIRVLLDHGVRPERVVFLSLLASARGGVLALHRAFPQVRVVLAGVDPGLRRRRVAKEPGAAAAMTASTTTSKRRGRERLTSFDEDAARGSGAASGSEEPTASGGGWQGPRTRREEGGAGSGMRGDGETRVCYSIEPGAGNIGSRYWL